MIETYAKARSFAILGIVLIIAIVAVGANSNPVLAQPCTAQLGYPVTAASQYYGSNAQVTVPVSATCSIYTSQLYAVGTAYTGYNSEIGTANTVLSAVYGNSFSGQLQFNIPVSVQTVQFSVSIYNAQNGYYQQYYGSQPLAVTSETYVVSPTYPTYPSYCNYNCGYPTYPSYPTYPTYPTYPSYPSYPSYQSHPYYPSYNGGYYRNNGGYYHNNGGYYHNNGGYYHNNGGYYHNNNPYCSNSNSCNHH